MAQYFVDFSGDTLGQPPSGWTLYDFLSTDLQVVSDASARGGQALRLYMSGVSSRRFASYDAAGAVEDSEMLVRFKCADPDYIFPAMMREQGDSMSTFSAYFVQKLNDTLSLRKYVGGASGTITSSSDPLENTSEWAYVRFQLSGSNIKIKTWAATESEPEAWDIEVTNTEITGAGRLGIFGYYSAKELIIDSIGFGTNGDVALDSEPVTQPENITVSLSGSSGSTGILSVIKSVPVAVEGSSGSIGTLSVGKSASVVLSCSSGAIGTISTSTDMASASTVLLSGSSGSQGVIAASKSSHIDLYGASGSFSDASIGKDVFASLSGESGSLGVIRIGELVSFAKYFSAPGAIRGTFISSGMVRTAHQTGVVIS